MIKEKLSINSFWNIVSTIKIYALALFIFSSFRFILFLNELNRINESTPAADIISAFIIGIRFDVVICGYILLLPFALLTINHFLNSKLINKIIFIYTFLFFLLAFLVNAADIPYFKQFFSRFSVTAFEWISTPSFVFKMIFEEPRYWLFIFPFIIALFVFYKGLKKIIFKRTNPIVYSNYLLSVLASTVFLGIMIIGIRGRLEKKSPIRIGTAYFCNNPFLNQLGLNPNFTLIRSFLDKIKTENKPITLIDDEFALAQVQKYFNINKINPDYPILRGENKIDSTSQLKNIVVIIMESMSAAKMERHGNTKGLTPFLDSIAKKSYYFENTYTAGIHTFNGIFGTIFSFPALFKQHPMKESAILKYHGIATTTKKIGYSTVYFTTHDGQFDNVEGFLKANDFERIVSQKDYPSNRVKTTLGVPDDFMFEFSIPVLNDLAKKNKPFLSVFMTASDHGPFYVPEYFKAKNKEKTQQVIEYADFSLKKFISLSEKQTWFKNTLFVFVADHGSPINATYDLSLNYNHTPLIFYQPEIIKTPKVFSKMAGQIDVFPSIMGLLEIQFENNTLGINLFKEERPYIYFNADDKYGVIDNEWLLIVHQNGALALHRYKENDLTNYANQYPNIVKRMKTYAESNLQTFQYLIKKQKV